MRRKAEGARISATSTRKALTEGALCFLKRLACDLEPMAPEARHQLNAPKLNFGAFLWAKMGTDKTI